MEADRRAASRNDSRITPHRFDACMPADRRALRSLWRRYRDRRRSGKPADQLYDRLLADLAAAEDRVAARRNRLPRPSFPSNLPIVAVKNDIAAALREHQAIVVCGETGSGKSTQLPKICLELGRGVNGYIGHTQPRRLAARTIAERIADELGSPLGRDVGYKIRFADQAPPDAFIKVMTDGVLLAETQRDRSLLQYDTLIIDEAHERSLNIDFLLGYVRNLLPRRADLKLIITSATIDPKRFSEHFANAPIIESSGRMYPVDVRYRPIDGGRAEDKADEPTRQPASPAESGRGGKKGKSKAKPPRHTPRRPENTSAEPPVDDRQLLRAIVLAVEEILSEPGGRGDVLVFLPGEREIREAAKALGKRLPAGVEVLPLFARLTSADQMKVFKPHPGRRVVLSTNVAETSVTVPGIRAVVDTGLARISRYAARSKVQRLPVEAISQASADQRKGRCGRLGPGLCIRLYSEEDFDQRDRFTAPEIQRSNLAGVILQMKALRLGSVEDFPFVDPPRPAMIRDGLHTLHEIGAVDASGDLTPLGRELAHYPVDPRIARMILAGRDENCLADVLVIAAALSVQDPRDRPFDRQSEADAAHARFRCEDSDFLTYLNLWDFYARQSANLSRNRLRRACAQNFLSYTRMREWVDVHRQLVRLAASRGLKIDEAGGNSASAHTRRADRRTDRIGNQPREIPDDVDADGIHRALLTGLLSNIGNLGEGYAYTGAGDVKFHLHPSSALFADKPKWIMCAEMVETTRLFARTIAPISPQWLLRLADHLLTRSHSQPRWQADSGHVVADEKVTLFGLTVVPRQTVHYGPIDPPLARQMFIQCALVEGDYRAKAPFLKHNIRLQRQVEKLEAKFRRRDLLVADAQRFEFYSRRLPEDVTNGPAFEKWRKQAENKQPRLLFMTEADLLSRDPEELAVERFPEQFTIGKTRLPIAYHFDPADQRDGVTITVPVEALGQLDERRLEWLVPGMLEEKIAEMIRTLPRSWRRSFVPAAQYANEAAEQIVFAVGDLRDAVAAQLRAMTGVDVPRHLWAMDQLPTHLRMNVRVVDHRGREMACGRSLNDLRLAVRKEQADPARPLRHHPFNRDNITRWDFDDLPAQVAVQGGGVDVAAFPAIVDQGASISLRLVDSIDQARTLTRLGLARLCALQMPDRIHEMHRRLADLTQTALHYAPLGSADALRKQIADLGTIRAVLGQDGTLKEHDPLSVRTHEQYHHLLADAWERLAAGTDQARDLAERILAAFHAVSLALDQSQPPAWADAQADLRNQLANLMRPMFLTRTPYPWLVQFPRYLAAISRRLEKLRDAGPARDARLLEPVTPHWRQCLHRLKRHHEANVFDPQLQHYRWMIEEFRVQVFAQDLRTAIPVSEAKLSEQWTRVQA